MKRRGTKRLFEKLEAALAAAAFAEEGEAETARRIFAQAEDPCADGDASRR